MQPTNPLPAEAERGFPVERESTEDRWRGRGRGGGRGQAGLGWVLSGALLLMAPVLANGVPFLYFDTVAYVNRPDGILKLLVGKGLGEPDYGETAVPVLAKDTASEKPDLRVLHKGRSFFYRIAGWGAAETGKLWPLVFLQALLTSWCVAILWVRVGGLSVGWPWLGLVAALTAFTPLGFFVGLIMPDVLSGAMVIAIVALALGWDGLRSGERLLLGGCVIFSAVSHVSHILLGIGVLGLLLALNFRDHSTRRGAALALLSIAFAGALDGLYGWVQSQRGVTMLSRPHLVAHLIDGGPAVGYLQRRCPEVGFAMCAFAERLPVPWIPFLFAADRPEVGLYAAAPDDLKVAISEEQSLLVVAVFADDPVGTLAFALRAAVEQLFRFDPSAVPMRPSSFETFEGYFPPWLGPMTRRSILFNNTWILGLVHAATVAAVVAAVVAAILSLRVMSAWPSGARWKPQLAGLGLVAGLVLNAVICGVLASPYDRFQARIVWLCPLAAAFLAASVWGRSSAAGTPFPDNNTEDVP